MVGKTKIQYKVLRVDYNFGTACDYPTIVMTLGEFDFNKKINACIDRNKNMTMYLSKSVFNELIGGYWDGSREDVKEIKKSLEGKIFTLDLNIWKK